jgi:hypothetical protein
MSEQPKFNNHYDQVKIDPRAQQVGIATRRRFLQQGIRNQNWRTNFDHIELPQSPKTEQLLKERPNLDRNGRVVISLDDLAREQLDPRVSRTINTFRQIEENLPDFMHQGEGLFRDVWGVNTSYHQWGKEEDQHAQAASLILEGTGFLTRVQIEEDYYQNLSTTWELPFPDNDKFIAGRMTVLYAAFQEFLTGKNYDKLADNAQACGALITAVVLRFIAADERYHHRGYVGFAKDYFAQDPDGTLTDAIWVAENFGMPAQNTISNPRQALVDIRKGGVYTPELARTSHLITFKNIGFVPQEQAIQATDLYIARTFPTNNR